MPTTCFLLGRPEQQHARIRRLIAAVEINCELLPRDGWKIEGKLRSIGMAVAFRCDASTLVLTTVCYAISTFCATANVDFLSTDA